MTRGNNERQDVTNQVIPDEAVEAAAEAINVFAAKYVGVLDPVPLNDMSVLDREHALGEARAALEAAVPYMLAPLLALADERDELAEVIWGVEAETLGTFKTGVTSRAADQIAEAILAAGYVKPRVVTTIAELDALPRLSVIRSDEGVVFEKHTMWHEAGSRDLKYSPSIALPAKVLQLGWGGE